jgi:iron complex outermembrane recepter protein
LRRALRAVGKVYLMKSCLQKTGALTAAASLAVCGHALAQPTTTQTIVVTGNPLNTRDLATPSSVLTGDALVLKRAGTLGETIDGLPGVSSTYFGPNANRPVIRGQDGDRIRVLSNASASVDASSLSFDHAVPIDPLVIERIEVLRGPAALLYGGSAVGGVVNAIDNRIPKARIDGVLGAIETRLAGAASERALSGLVEGGSGGLAWHADGFGRSTSDQRVPAFDRPRDDGGSERSTRIRNSASRAKGGAVGGSWVGERGYVGASVDTYRNDYGIVAEDDVTIRMHRDKLALAGEWRSPQGPLPTLKAQLAQTRYRHQEVEGTGAIGTTFKSQGTDARIDVTHAALPLLGGRVEGAFGVQAETVDFSALGEEAFVPNTQTRHVAGFVVERFSWGEGSAGSGHVSAGLRAEQVRVDSLGDETGTDARFGSAQQRRFTPRSVSLGGLLELGAGWQLSSSMSSTTRAPTSYELYANGVHAATSAFERGDPAQRQERGRHVDIGLAWRAGAHGLKLSAFESRFANYIALDATSEPEFVDEEGNAFPVFAFQGVRARLRGYEIEGSWRAWEGAWRLDLEARLDAVEGVNRDSGQALPRLSPTRATLGAQFTQGEFGARLEVQRLAAQDRVPATDSATRGYTLVHLSASYALHWGGSKALLFARLHNAGDVLGFSASTVATVRALSPLPGRSLAAGLRVTF